MDGHGWVLADQNGSQQPVDDGLDHLGRDRRERLAPAVCAVIAGDPDQQRLEPVGVEAAPGRPQVVVRGVHFVRTRTQVGSGRPQFDHIRLHLHDLLVDGLQHAGYLSVSRKQLSRASLEKHGRGYLEVTRASKRPLACCGCSPPAALSCAFPTWPRLLSLTLSTASRLLATLEAAGFVDRDPVSGLYRLGLDMVSLGGAVLNNHPVHREARQIAQNLAAELGLGANVAVRRDDQLFYLLNFEGRQAPRSFVLTGQRNPLHATGLGKALLSGLTPQERRALLPNLTPYIQEGRAEQLDGDGDGQGETQRDSDGETERQAGDPATPANIRAVPVGAPPPRTAGIVCAGVAGPPPRRGTSSTIHGRTDQAERHEGQSDPDQHQSLEQVAWPPAVGGDEDVLHPLLGLYRLDRAGRRQGSGNDLGG